MVNMGTPTARHGKRRKIEPGPTSEQVSRNVRALRERQGLTLQELAERLAQIGWPILASGLSKIEQGDRRVDADDLMALAVALNASPLTLLLPSDRRADVEVGLTPGAEASQAAAWQWGLGVESLSFSGQPPEYASWQQIPPADRLAAAAKRSSVAEALLDILREERAAPNTTAGWAETQRIGERLERAYQEAALARAELRELL